MTAAASSATEGRRRVSHEILAGLHVGGAGAVWVRRRSISTRCTDRSLNKFIHDGGASAYVLDEDIGLALNGRRLRGERSRAERKPNARSDQTAP